MRILEELKMIKELDAWKELSTLKEMNLLKELKELEALKELKNTVKGLGEKELTRTEKIAIFAAVFFAGIILGMLISPKGKSASCCGGCGCGEEEEEA